MRIAVLGARGQLGSDLLPRLPGEVIPLSRAEMDLDRPGSIAVGLQAVRPDVLVNCAAYNFVDRAESEPDAAFLTNVWGVRELAKACRDQRCRLVHLSTDYVFGLDEDRTAPLSEDDPPGPVGVYGLSKLAGEYFVRGASPSNLVVRTCGLYGVKGNGGKGGNFVETMRRLAGSGKPIRVVNDQRCTPTYTVDLAVAVAELIERNGRGIYHVTSAGDCTWYEFAAEIFRRSDIKVDLAPITTAEFGAPARRPRYSVLAMDRLIRDGFSPMPPWQDALARYLRDRPVNSSAT